MCLLFNETGFNTIQFVLKLGKYESCYNALSMTARYNDVTLQLYCSLTEASLMANIWG